MTLLVRFLSSCIASILLVAHAARAAAPESHGVAFDPSPQGEWRCGLTTDDMPGLAAERMLHPLAAGCTRGEAKAFAVVVDLSDSRFAMSAEQMAADAEDQLPTSWKIDSKSYDLVSLSGGQTAAYSRLVGKGDGFTFLSGQKPMVAISYNVPLVFQNESETPQQAIAVFRARSPLPAGMNQRKLMIEELDQSLRAWAGTAHPASNRVISAREFELAAHARASGKGSTPIPAAAPAPAARKQPGGNDRIAAAVTAAVRGRATEADLEVLADVEKRFGQEALGLLAQSLREDIRRASLQKEQQQILSAVMEAAAERASDILSSYLIAAMESRDSVAVESALRVAESRGWPLRNLSPAAIDTVAAEVLKRDFPFATDGEDRTFLEFPSNELLSLVSRTRTVPPIEDLVRNERDHWRMKDRRSPTKVAYLVQSEKNIGILERQQGTDVYRYRPVTNLVDVAAVDP
jgi:hypothetical protein